MLPLLVGLLTQENRLKQPDPDDPMPDEVEIAGRLDPSLPRGGHDGVARRFGG